MRVERHETMKTRKQTPPRHPVRRAKRNVARALHDALTRRERRTLKKKTGVLQRVIQKPKIKIQKPTGKGVPWCW